MTNVDENLLLEGWIMTLFCKSYSVAYLNVTKPIALSGC